MQTAWKWFWFNDSNWIWLKFQWTIHSFQIIQAYFSLYFYCCRILYYYHNMHLNRITLSFSVLLIWCKWCFYHKSFMNNNFLSVCLIEFETKISLFSTFNFWVTFTLQRLNKRATQNENVFAIYVHLELLYCVRFYFSKIGIELHNPKRQNWKIHCKFTAIHR